MLAEHPVTVSAFAVTAEPPGTATSAASSLTVTAFSHSSVPATVDRTTSADKALLEFLGSVSLPEPDCIDLTQQIASAYRLDVLCEINAVRLRHANCVHKPQSSLG